MKKNQLPVGMKTEIGELFKRYFNIERIIGKKNIEDIIVINKLIKSKIPIDSSDDLDTASSTERTDSCHCTSKYS